MRKRAPTSSGCWRLTTAASKRTRAWGMPMRAFAASTRRRRHNARRPGSLGIAYTRAGDPGKAAAPLKSAIGMVEAELRVNPKKADLYSYLAFYKATLGQKEGVDKLLQKARELAPEDMDIMIRTAET